MKTTILTLLVLLGLASSAHAQATATSNIAWKMNGPTLAVVQAYAYSYYSDGSVNKTVLPNTVCTGTVQPFVCSAPFPAFTPGNHTMQISATNSIGESPKSTPPFAFIFGVIPDTPFSLSIADQQ